MREAEARGGERRELRLDLAPELGSTGAQEILPRVADAGVDGRTPKGTVRGDEVGDLRRRGGGPALGEYEVEPDGEARRLARELHRFLDGVARHHEARAGEDAVAVRADDGGVHLGGGPEVVGGHHQPTRRHAGSSIAGSGPGSRRSRTVTASSSRRSTMASGPLSGRRMPSFARPSRSQAARMVVPSTSSRRSGTSW